MREIRYYNPNILKDDTVPENTRFLTSLSLTKKTYSDIETVMKTLPQLYGSKGQVVDAALYYFIKHIKEITESQVISNG